MPAAIAGVGLMSIASAQAADCAAMAALALPDTVITAAEVVPAGTYQQQANLPEFCRIAGEIHNHPTSRIKFEMWLPTQIPNQRFVQVGNGGFAGTIQYSAMAPRLRDGYATVSTDDGTTPAPGVPASQQLTFLADLERLDDFKGRAVTLTAGVAKALFQVFYGLTPKFSYFTGCSSGGLEALAAAQRIGDQFDGISAGSPASNSAGLFTQALWTYKYYQQFSTKLTLVHNAAVAACDKVGDGVADGIIGNPEKCTFDPVVLRCQAGDQANCLTDAQVNAVRMVYQGPVDPATGTKTGEQYAPGMPRGSELAWTGSVAQAQSGAAEPWYGMLLHDSLTFDIADFDFGADVTRALNITLPYGAQVTNPDLSALRNHGGKIMMYAGWEDPLWSQQNLVNYYKQVIAKNLQATPGRPINTVQMGADALARTQAFARLYMMPGVGHCGGGEGAGTFDTFPPLVNWVEHGSAPASIPASHTGTGTAFTRPVCAYPTVAQWNGQGDPNDATNFSCVSQ